jgi:hypothetical protein
MKISYAITACNEYIELERLLRFLKENIREEDEVVIQLDYNHSNSVLEVCNLFTGFNHKQDLVNTIKNSQFYAFSLDNNFAQFKNQLSRFVTGNYIFQIDADEVPHKNLIKNLPAILEANPDNEVYLVPRINIVDGITLEHIEKWKWNVDPISGWVNFPDWQWRIYKNDSKIRWINKVHERLTGFKSYAPLPAEEDYCLYHIKNIQRQEKQNEFYNTL